MWDWMRFIWQFLVLLCLKLHTAIAKRCVRFFNVYGVGIKVEFNCLSCVCSNSYAFEGSRGSLLWIIIIFFFLVCHLYAVLVETSDNFKYLIMGVILKVGLDISRREFSIESSLQGISSNLLLWKWNDSSALMSTWSWCGKPAASAWACLREANTER